MAEFVKCVAGDFREKSSDVGFDIPVGHVDNQDGQEDDVAIVEDKYQGPLTEKNKSKIKQDNATHDTGRGHDIKDQFPFF